MESQRSRFAEINNAYEVRVVGVKGGWMNIQGVFSSFFVGDQGEEEERVVIGDDVIVEVDASLEDLCMGGSLKLRYGTIDLGKRAISRLTGSTAEVVKVYKECSLLIMFFFWIAISNSISASEDVKKN